MSKSSKSTLFGLSALLIISQFSLHALDATWQGTTSTDLLTPTNWSGFNVPNGSAIFDSTASTQLPTLTGSFPISQFLFPVVNAASYTFTLSGGGANLTLTGIGINNSANLNQVFNITSGAIQFNNSANADSTMSNLITVNLLGNSQLIFTGTSSSSSLNIVFNGLSNQVQFDQTASDQFLGSIVETSSNGNSVLIDLPNTSTLTFSGSNSYFATTTITSGILLPDTSNSLSPNSIINVLNNSTLNLNGFSNTISALSGSTGGNVILENATLSVSNTTATTYAGSTTGAGGLTMLLTSTGIFTLSGSGTNTYSGETTLLAGTLQAGATNAFSANSDFVISSPAILSLNNFNNVIGSLSGVSGAVQLGSGTLSFSDNMSTAYAGSITGTGGLTQLSTSTGTFTLSGSGINTYSGATTLQGGTWQAGATNSFSASSDIVILSPAILDLNNFNNTIGSLSGASGSVQLGSGILSFSDSASTTYGGSIIDTGGLTKLATSTGIFTLTGSAANTYSGQTTLLAGSFQAGATDAFSSQSNVVLTSPAVLDLNNYNNTIGSLAGTNGSVTLGGGTLSLSNATATNYGGSITGAGGITKQDLSTGVFTLSGSGINTYSGATTLQGGTLESAALNAFSPNSDVTLSSSTILNLNNFNNTVGSLAGVGGSVTLGSGILTLADDASTTFGGSITGTGGVTKSSLSVGTFILSGSGLNTYSGATTLLAGTWQAGAVNAFSGSSDIIMFSPAILDLNNFNNTIGSLSGTGGAVQLGSGTLSFSNTMSTTYAGSITGEGGLTKLATSSGVFTLSGASLNNYTGATTLDAGTLQAGATNAFSPSSEVILSSSTILSLNGFDNTIGSLSGTGGIVAIGPNTLTMGTIQNSTYAGSFTGSGNLITQGSGTFTLSGNSSAFSGTTQVNNSLFILDNVLGGNITVQNGATFGGVGTVGGNLTINSSATISPGNSIGTINVSGNYTQNPNSTYYVEVNAQEQSDLINITGSATLNGGQVIIDTTQGIDLNYPYVLLNATGGVTGTFASASSSSSLFLPTLIYTPNQVIFDYQTTTIINAAYSPNTVAVATQIDSIGGIITPAQFNILNNLVSLSIPEASLALYEITGQQHTATSFVTELLNRQFVKRLYDPLRPLVTANPFCYDFSPPNPYDQGLDFWMDGSGGYYSMDGNINASGIKLR